MRLPFEKHYKNQTHSLAHSHSFICVLEALTLPSFLSFIPKSKPKFPPSTFSPKSTTTTVKPIHLYFIRIYTYREWVRERERRMDSDQGKLFIGGISWDTTEDKLKEHFGNYDDVLSTSVMREKNTGKPRGFGFVVFADPNILDRVMEDKHVIDGRTVTLLSFFLSFLYFMFRLKILYCTFKCGCCWFWIGDNLETLFCFGLYQRIMISLLTLICVALNVLGH